MLLIEAFFRGGGDRAAFQLTAITIHSQTFKANRHIDNREQSIQICGSEIEIKRQSLDVIPVPHGASPYFYRSPDKTNCTLTLEGAFSHRTLPLMRVTSVP